MISTLPYNIDAEQSILSAMLLNPKCRAKVRTILSAEDFYKETHQALYPIVSIEDLDLVGIWHELEKQGLTDRAGGKKYLQELAGKVSTSAQVMNHVGIVKELSTRRKLVNLCYQVSDGCQEKWHDNNELIRQLREGIISLETQDDGFKPYVDISNVYDAERCLKEYYEYIRNQKKNRFITGIGEIDYRIRGVAGGEVLFVIARAGTFKTAILQNMIFNYTQNSAWAVAFFSIEMPVSTIAERYHEIIHGSSGQDIEDIYANVEAESVRERLEKIYIEKLKNVYIIPTHISIQDIPSYMKVIQTEKKIKIGVIGVDYLGLMEGEGRGEYEIISNLAKNLKTMAKKLNVPVIVLSQTSRRGGSGDVELTMDMGRGSGAIEEAADFVLGLYQDGKELICKILKNRKGASGSRWRLDLDPTNLRIGHWAEEWTPKAKEGKGYGSTNSSLYKDD